MKRKSRRQIEEEYDELYARVNDLITKTNPCEVRIVNKTAYCMSCSYYVCGDKIQPNELCCDGCKHHNKDKGCQANKPLFCKLWLCSKSKAKYPKVATALFNFRTEAEAKFGCLLFRGDKKDTIDHIIHMDMRALYTA